MIYTEESNKYMRLLNIIKSSSKASTLLYELFDMIKFSWYFLFIVISDYMYICAT